MLLNLHLIFDLRFLRNTLFKLLYLLGIGGILRLTKRNKFPILVFHRISNEFDPYTEPLPTACFDSFITFLKRKYRIRPLKDLFSLRPKDCRYSCFITFDDAMEDFFYNASPVIEKHQIPITLFVPTEASYKGKQLWNHRYFACFIYSRNKKVHLKVGGKDYHFDLQKSPEYNQVMELHNFILRANKETREEVLNLLEEKLLPEDDYRTFASVMDPQDLIRLPKEISLGSHTVTHSYLPALTDDYLEEELEESKKEIERTFNVVCDTIAYPNGGVKESQLHQIRKYYSNGFAVGDRLADISKILDPDYRLMIPRININDKSVFELYLRINGFHHLIKAFVILIKSPLKIFRSR